MAQDRPDNQARIASIVMLVAIVGWMGVSWLGGKMEWPVRYAILADLATLAALVWALWVLFQVWRKRRHNEG